MKTNVIPGNMMCSERCEHGFECKKEKTIQRRPNYWQLLHLRRAWACRSYRTCGLKIPPRSKITPTRDTQLFFYSSYLYMGMSIKPDARLQKSTLK